jgi:hypothetical protein
MGSAISESGKNVTDSTQAQLQLSFASADDLASKHPAQADQIVAAAKQSFLDGDQWAYTAALVAVLVGMSLVFFVFPRKDAEEALHVAYHAEDVVDADGPPPAPAVAPREAPA